LGWGLVLCGREKIRKEKENEAEYAFRVLFLSSFDRDVVT
jgi:hypothetical protein